MNEFKEKLKVNREKSGRIIIDKKLEELLIDLMKGKISKQTFIEITGIGDKQTIEKKIEEVVSENPRWSNLYKEYVSRKNENFEGYDFKNEAVDMLRNDYSQSEMAKRIGVSRRSFSAKMKKLQEENQNNTLGKLLSNHAIRKMNRRKISDEEYAEINDRLDKYEKENPLDENSKYHKKDPVVQRLKNITKAMENQNISESTYRKYRAEAEKLNKIVEQNVDNSER